MAEKYPYASREQLIAIIEHKDKETSTLKEACNRYREALEEIAKNDFDAYACQKAQQALKRDDG